MNLNISYLKFLLKSTNQHGVHSPFVYDLVTKCLYSKKKYPNLTYNEGKRQQLVLNIIDYFKPSSAWSMGDGEYFGDENWSETFDFILFLQPSLDDFEEMFPTINNDSVWLINGIYRTRKAQRFWKQLIQHEKVTVTVDTYHMGLVFFRKEQKKEHFTIRI